MSEAIKPSTTVYVASFGALLGAVSMGLALGYTTPAFDNMEKNLNSSSVLSQDKDMRESQKGLIGSMLAVGALVGGFLGEPSNKILGRKLSLIAYGVPFIIGWLCLLFANGVPMLVIGRVLTGLCSGLVSGTAPTYVVEIAPPSIRGLLGTCFQVMVVIGILLACVFGLFCTWAQLAGWSLVPSLITMGIMFFMPETPQWLLSKGRNQEAEESLKTLRTTPVAQELSIMAQAAANAQEGGQYSRETITSREFYKPFMLALGLMFFQQFSGINAVLFYQTDIFKKASPTSDALMSAIYVCIAQVIATVLASILVDRLGRKMLLFASGLGHTLSLIVFGWFSYRSAADQTFQEQNAWIPLASLVIFVVSFSLGYGPVPWMMIPELSSTRVRSLVASLATAFNWTCVYIVTAAVKPMIASLGDAGTYWSFAVVCAASCFFVYFALLETKGRTSEQIQDELLGRRQSQPTVSQGEQMKILA